MMMQPLSTHHLQLDLCLVPVRQAQLVFTWYHSCTQPVLSRLSELSVMVLLNFESMGVAFHTLISLASLLRIMLHGRKEVPAYSVYWQSVCPWSNETSNCMSHFFLRLLLYKDCLVSHQWLDCLVSHQWLSIIGGYHIQTSIRTLPIHWCTGP